MNYPQYVSKWLLDIVFPIRCIGCGIFPPSQKKTYLCQGCIRQIPINNSGECIGCKQKSLLGKTCRICKKSNWLDQLLIASDYKNDLVVKAIKTFKYRFIQEMAEPLSIILKKYITRLNKDNKFSILSDSPIIIPIPLHSLRLNWRGFNQADLIAKLFAQSIQTNTHTDIITRIKKSKPQADIKQKDDRLKNLKYKFRVTGSSKIKNKTVILIDDICTTGATLNECARILKEAGAQKVVGLVVARG